MDQVWTGVFLVAALLMLLGSGIWIALALLGVGWLAMELYTSTPVGKLMATSVWGASNNWSLLH